jgi:hypothetical protein
VRLSFGWGDNIKADLQELLHEGVKRNYLPWDKDEWWAFVNAIMNIRVAQIRGNS